MLSVSEISETSVPSSSSTCILSQTLSAPSRPAFGPANIPHTSTSTKRPSRVDSDDMYVKRGRKGSNNLYLMEEAVAAIKDLSKEETSEADAYDHFACIIWPLNYK